MLKEASITGKVMMSVRLGAHFRARDRGPPAGKAHVGLVVGRGARGRGRVQRGRKILSRTAGITQSVRRTARLSRPTHLREVQAVQELVSKQEGPRSERTFKNVVAAKTEAPWTICHDARR